MHTNFISCITLQHSLRVFFFFKFASYYSTKSMPMDMTKVYQHIFFSVIVYCLDITWRIIESWAYKLFPIIPSNLYFPPSKRQNKQTKITPSPGLCLCSQQMALLFSQLINNELRHYIIIFLSDSMSDKVTPLLKSLQCFSNSLTV